MKKFFFNLINNSYFFFSILIFSYILINILFYSLFIIKYPNFIDTDGILIINQLTHAYAGIINNLLEQRGYFSNFFDFDAKFYLGRLPLIPYFLYFNIMYISEKYLILLIIKNLFFFLIILSLAKISLKNNLQILFLITSLFIIPYNLQISLMIVPEEGYINYLIICLFIVFQSNVKFRIQTICLILVALFFTKGSLCFFIYSISFYFLLVEKEKLPIISIILCYLIWASYGYIKTDKIISPVSLVSIGGITLSSANNEKFNDYYPEYNPDLTYPYILGKHKKNYENLTNEFEIDDYFKNYNIDYIKNNKIEFTKGLLKKIYVIFFNLKNDALELKSEKVGKFRLSNFINLPILYFTIYIILKKFISRKIEKKEIFLLTFCISYLFPFMIGFVYTRHLVPIYSICILYLFYECFKKNIQTEQNHFDKIKQG